MRSRGFAGIEVLIWLGVIAAVLGGLYWVASALDERGHDRGVAERDAFYTKRDNAALAQSNLRIKALEEEARATERRHAADMAKVAGDLQKDLDDERTRNSGFIADVRAGRLQLRDPGAASAACGVGGAAGKAGTAAGSGDGAPSGLLSGSASEFLLGLAGEADAVVRQLGACQAVIIKDRE